MTTVKQREAAKRNVVKAQAAWRSMSSRQRALAQPAGHERKRPGAGGGGDYYHVEVRRSADFKTFRTQDVGEPGHVQRVAGQRASGSWDTVKWLISKEDAHVEADGLVADTEDAKGLLSRLGSRPVHVKGDIFQAKPRRNVPEAEKPTPAQKRARSTNIRKAHAARHKAS